MDPHSFEIIDSHIHLWPSSEIDTLAWQTPDGPLYSQHSVAEYKQAVQVPETGTNTTTSSIPNQKLKGFIFIEADRKSHLQDESGWTHAFQEIAFLNRIWTGQPKPGEGHLADDRGLCLGIVPWAPIPSGPLVLQKYWNTARSLSNGKGTPLIRGFRYLVQDKPKGTMLQHEFIDSLVWMGKQGLVFDLGIDQRSGGIWQLDEAIAMIEQVEKKAEQGKEPKIVLNHLCKPNMLKTLSGLSEVTDSSFLDWFDRMRRLAAFPNTYMKLSGGFSESPPLPTAEAQAQMSFWERHEHIVNAAEHMRFWIYEVVGLWSASRCMFGSDWPVCNINGGGNENAWMGWRAVVRSCIVELEEVDQEAIWSGTAREAYGLEERK